MKAEPMLNFDDARMPTDGAREGLAKLMYMAICDLRALANDGPAEQAKDLSEAFHNIPLLMNSENFSFKAFRTFLQRYQEKYKVVARFNYLEEWEKLNGNASAQ